MRSSILEAEGANLLDRFLGCLEPSLLQVTEAARALVRSQGLSLYAVGGIVRDLLLERPSDDLDLALEGSPAQVQAVVLALANEARGRVTSHPRFGTAVLELPQGLRVDVAMTRLERYLEPGALPLVAPGTIREDLQRRDFTLNSLALGLEGPHRGGLLDPFGGHDDLDRKTMRILHPASFIDDPTRILRGVRLEQRLGFAFDPDTQACAARAVREDCLECLSLHRVAVELEVILEEPCWVSMLKRLSELEVWPHLGLPRPDARVQALLDAVAAGLERVSRAHLARPFPGALPRLGELRLAVLGLEGGPDWRQRAAQLLGLGPEMLRQRRARLDGEGLSPSQLEALLQPCSPGVLAVLAACSPRASQQVQVYLERVWPTPTLLTGADLRSLGGRPGPRFGELLRAARALTLDEGWSRTRLLEWAAERLREVPDV